MTAAGPISPVSKEEPQRSGLAPPAPRIYVLATEDWFVVSHFLPLLDALRDMGADVSVVTRVGTKRAEIEATGARIVSFDFGRDGRLSPLRELSVAARLRRLLARDRPDAVHAIALKPISVACLIAPTGIMRRLAIHLTGVGFAGTTGQDSLTGRIYGLMMRFVGMTLRRPSTWLFVENPDDMVRLGIEPSIAARATVLGGAGVDPAKYPVPLSMHRPSTPTRAGFVGRMVWSKGVDVLIEAQRLLRENGHGVEVHLCGEPDPANPRSISRDELAIWQETCGVVWHGRVDDIAGFWQGVSFAVVPSRGGEGLPRALLEAAVSARALIVTDVPGCRLFVRDGIEGFVVPPSNAHALSQAMARLARDPSLAAEMGQRARERVLRGFTEAHVKTAIQAAYRTLLSG